MAFILSFWSESHLYFILCAWTSPEGTYLSTEQHLHSGGRDAIFIAYLACGKPYQKSQV